MFNFEKNCTVGHHSSPTVMLGAYAVDVSVRSPQKLAIYFHYYQEAMQYATVNDPGLQQ